ncbi:copper resistance CopC family protein [Beijerinckia mobilis]|uniref:copper resistance CopC family protein n=1 Tax=Beijerinckia mobilis TaxID=231434 RepID=UPI000557DE12|nr:copper resistance CopC family protein [Beijerinckia mobilis]
MRYRFLSALFVLSAALLTSQRALPHAIVLNSSPAINAVVTGESVAIHLHFNSRIDHARSKLTLYAPDGTQGNISLSADSPADDLNTEVKALTPGAWRLRWQVLSTDGHITRGDIPFTVR